MTSSLPPEPDPAADPVPGDTPESGAAENDAEVWGSIWSEALQAAFGTLPPDPEITDG